MVRIRSKRGSQPGEPQFGEVAEALRVGRTKACDVRSSGKVSGDTSRRGSARAPGERPSPGERAHQSAPRRLKASCPRWVFRLSVMKSSLKWLEQYAAMELAPMTRKGNDQDVQPGQSIKA